MKESLQVMERLMPSFFKDAVLSYENLQIDFKRSGAKNKKPISDIPEDKMATLSNVFKYENYAKTKLNHDFFNLAALKFSV